MSGRVFPLTTQTSSGVLQCDHVTTKQRLALPLKTTFTLSLHNNVRSLFLAQDALCGSVFIRYPSLPRACSA